MCADGESRSPHRPPHPDPRRAKGQRRLGGFCPKMGLGGGPPAKCSGEPLSEPPRTHRGFPAGEGAVCARVRALGAGVGCWGVGGGCRVDIALRGGGGWLADAQG